VNQLIFHKKHPYGAAALLFLCVLLAFLVSGTAVALLGLAPEALYFLAFGALALVCAGLLTKNGWWREVGFRWPTERRLLWLFWLPFVPVIGNLLDGIQVTEPAQIMLFFVTAVLSSFVEETLFRGLILRALLPIGVWRAAILSAVMFGGLHILNALAISSPGYALLQVGYAAAIGFGYAALLIRTGTIWPLILAHFLTNFAGFMAAGSAGAAGPIALRDYIFAAVYIFLFTAYGIYLLRPSVTRSGES
jgi:membrane protease YdiL (CAAX protease family)